MSSNPKFVSISAMEYVLGWVMGAGLRNEFVEFSIGDTKQTTYIKVHGRPVHCQYTNQNYEMCEDIVVKHLTAYDSGVVEVHIVKELDGSKICIYSSMDCFGHDDILWCELEELMMGLNLRSAALILSSAALNMPFTDP